MDKKKIILIIAAIVVAVALVVTGIVLALKGAFEFKSSEGENSDITISDVSSIVGNTDDTTSEGDKTNNENGNGSNSGNNSSTTKPSNSGKVEINVGTVSGKKGKTVRVPVTIDSNPGFMAMLIDFEYDKDVLTYKGYTKGNVLSDYEFSDKGGKLSFLCVESQDITTTGDLFYLEFEIKSNKVKETPVKITITDQSISNWDEQFVPSKTSDGKVTIK